MFPETLVTLICTLEKSCPWADAARLASTPIAPITSIIATRILLRMFLLQWSAALESVREAALGKAPSQKPHTEKGCVGARVVEAGLLVAFASRGTDPRRAREIERGGAARSGNAHTSQRSH